MVQPILVSFLLLCSLFAVGKPGDKTHLRLYDRSNQPVANQQMDGEQDYPPPPPPHPKG
jgi:hypothetical protein